MQKESTLGVWGGGWRGEPVDATGKKDPEVDMKKNWQKGAERDSTKHSEVWQVDGDGGGVRRGLKC